MKKTAAKPAARTGRRSRTEQKPRVFSGNLHLRTTPEIHEQVFRNAERKGFTIQDYIETAVLTQMERDHILFKLK